MNTYFDMINNFEWKSVAIDKAHSALLYGTVLSAKPKTLLEIGIGSGFVTKTLLAGIKYNAVGKLISVDSWNDWK